MESMLGRAILTSRWLLAVFFLGLVLGLAAFAVRFLHKLWKMVVSTFVGEDTDLLIALLHLVDYALVASLVVMVALASWDSLVGLAHRPFQPEDQGRDRDRRDLIDRDAANVPADRPSPGP